MILGLALGKRFLVADQFEASRSVQSPVRVYFFAANLANGCLLAASFVAGSTFTQGFPTYLLLMGFLNGMFSGVAYTAPMLSCQLYFPDRK